MTTIEPPRYAQVLTKAMREFGEAASIDFSEVERVFPGLKWKAHIEDADGRIHYAIIDGNRETGEVWILILMIHATALEHEHTDGELLIGIAGELEDETDDGESVLL